MVKTPNYTLEQVEAIVQEAVALAVDKVIHPNLDNSSAETDGMKEEENLMPSTFRKRITLSDGQVIELRGNNMADAFERAVRQYAQPVTKELKSLLFQEYAQEWFDLYHVPVSGERWINESRGLLRKHILPFFGSIRLNEITVSDIQRFFSSKAALSKSTNKHLRYMLNGIFGSAVEDELVSRNIMSSKRITISTKETKRKALTVEQVQDILSGLDKLSLQERLLILLLLYTGMRRGEILALEWDRVDFENRLIHVNAAVDFENGNTPSLKGPKSEAGIRLLPILPPLMEALKEAHAVAQNTFVIGDHAVPVTKRAYECMFNRIRTSINLHGATAHVFRHTFITMCSAYLDPKTTQSLAGHAKCDITLNRYAHAQERLIRAAGDDLAGIYNT